MDLWVAIKSLEGKTLHTIDRKEPFVVAQVLHDRVVIENSLGKERPIRWSEIGASWDHLEQHGTVTRAEIMESYSSYNSAYVAAILANVDGVSSNMRPIILRLGSTR
jgi:hypothetical protein